MITISVKEDLKSWNDAKDKLGEKKFNQAIYRALNETTRQGRTVARAVVKEIYNIPQRYVHDINFIAADSHNLRTKLYASAQPLPMDAFAPKFQTANNSISITKKGQQKVNVFKRIKSNPIAGVSIEVIRGKREIIPFAFMIPASAARVFARGEYKNGSAYGFVQRHQRVNSGGADIPIKPLLSITVHAAVINKEALGRVEERVNTVFPLAIKRNIDYLLSLNGS